MCLEHLTLREAIRGIFVLLGVNTRARLVLAEQSFGANHTSLMSESLVLTIAVDFSTHRLVNRSMAILHR